MQAVPTHAVAEASSPKGRSPIPADELRRLQQRSDQKGLLRLAGHLGAIALAATLHALALRGSHGLLGLLTGFLLGATLVTMFACMHEAVHRTAFKSQWLNDTVG